jgi:hypothetical protein
LLLVAGIMTRLSGRGAVLAWTAAALAGPLAGGCGTGTRAAADGGRDTSSPDSLAPGRRAFDVVAALTTATPNSEVPPTNTFTLVLDAAARVVIAGGEGNGAVVPVTSADGRSFRSQGSFIVGGPPSVCPALVDFRYDSFDIAVRDDGSLGGTAQGSADISCGDCGFDVAFTAVLNGTPDATPPVLHAAGLDSVTAFDSFGLMASEPMPASATARLTGSAGATIDLTPQVVDGAIPLVVGFSKPNVVLPVGQGYVVAFDGLVDFAGQTDQTAPLRLTSFPSAPLVPQDGFESATGNELGGALIVAAGQLPAITGTTSLYIGSTGAPLLGSSVARSLLVRLARPAGSTTLRFSYRVIAAQAQEFFSGTVGVGSEGRTPGPSSSGFISGTATQPLSAGAQTLYAGAVGTLEATLPDDAGDEVLVSVAPSSLACSGPLQAPNGGLLIDDLRLE